VDGKAAREREAPAAAVMVKVKKEDVEPRIAIIANPQ
jgi:hypothetical protein